MFLQLKYFAVVRNLIFWVFSCLKHVFGCAYERIRTDVTFVSRWRPLTLVTCIRAGIDVVIQLKGDPLRLLLIIVPYLNWIMHSFNCFCSLCECWTLPYRCKLALTCITYRNFKFFWPKLRVFCLFLLQLRFPDAFIDWITDLCYTFFNMCLTRKRDRFFPFHERNAWLRRKTFWNISLYCNTRNMRLLRRHILLLNNR